MARWSLRRRVHRHSRSAASAPACLAGAVLPVAARDPGFRLLGELCDLREWAWETMCHQPGAAEAAALRRLDDAIAEERREPLIAQRSFEPITHCPAGHVGAHRIGQSISYAGRACVQRWCCVPLCGHAWLEGR